MTSYQKFLPLSRLTDCKEMDKIDLYLPVYKHSCLNMYVFYSNMVQEQARNVSQKSYRHNTLFSFSCKMKRNQGYKSAKLHYIIFYLMILQ